MRNFGIRIARLELMQKTQHAAHDAEPLRARLLLRLKDLGDRIRATADLAFAVSGRVDADGNRLHAFGDDWHACDETTEGDARAIVQRRLVALGFRQEHLQ